MKITLEKFQDLKNQLIKILDDIEKAYEASTEVFFYHSEEYKELENKYLEVQNEILSYDLSDIPFEEYEGIEFLGDFIDFSNTHANIDFSLLEFPSFNGNFKGCKLKNIHSFRGEATRDSFDESFVQEHANIFLDDSIDNENLVDAFARGRITLKELDKYYELLKDKDLEFGCRNNDFVITEKFRDLFGDIKSFLSEVPRYMWHIIEACYPYKDLNDINTKEEYLAASARRVLSGSSSIIKSDINLNVLYYFSKYIPLNEFLGTDMENIVNKIGFENLVKFNNDNGMIFDNLQKSESIYFPIRDYGYMRDYLIYANSYNDGDDLNEIFKQAIIKRRKHYMTVNNPSYDAKQCRLFSKIFPGEFIDYDILDPLLENNESKEYIEKQLFYAFNGQTNELEEILSDYPELLEAIKGKNIMLKREAYKSLGSQLSPYFPQLFLDENAPDILKTGFTPIHLYNNPSWISFLENKDLYLLIHSTYINWLEQLEKELHINDNDFLNICVKYGDVISYLDNPYRLEKINPTTLFSNNNIQSLEDFEGVMKKEKVNMIKNNGLYQEKDKDVYYELIPEAFIVDNVSEEFKTKFYNKELQISDFLNNKEMQAEIQLVMDKTLLYFGISIQWLKSLYNENDDVLTNNKKILKALAVYDNLDYQSRSVFEGQVALLGRDLSEEKIVFLVNAINRLSMSNSSELERVRLQVLTQAFSYKTEEEINRAIDKIVNIFVKNKVPYVGKAYKVFEYIHPSFDEYVFNSDIVSPVLAKSSSSMRRYIIFADLIKASFGSNNRSIREFFHNVEAGYNVYLQAKANNILYESLTDEQKSLLSNFVSIASNLYNNSRLANSAGEPIDLTGDALRDIEDLKGKLSLSGSSDYEMVDRLVYMFCGFATGIDTLEAAKKYMQESKNRADKRNRERALSKPTLSKGDLIKGIGNISYLANILQNGSVAKEFLGAESGSDSTPLDTDVSMVLAENGTIYDLVFRSMAFGYGSSSAWIVLKNDGRFITTRDENGLTESKRDMSKIEVFRTLPENRDQYGIRTGFASSEIDYFLVNNYQPEIGLEIAMNGFYIPVYNLDGDLVFSPKDYDDLRSKMSGLSYYDVPEYIISSNLISEEIMGTRNRIEQSVSGVIANNQMLGDKIADAIRYAGVDRVCNGFSYDLTNGLAELYATGSTSRYTNVPNDADYDFLIKVDRTTYFSTEKLEEFKRKMKERLGFVDGYGGKIQGTITTPNNEKLDVEISFCPRTDKIEFSTDYSLVEKLESIKNQYPDSYMDVIANIVYAKELFKSIGAYKSLKSDASQGGLGGIGIENWILQHGGSFYDAAMSFVKTADSCKSFSEFCQKYQVFDFGSNHYSVKDQNENNSNNFYPHDNFVGGYNKMGEDGYKKMVAALRKYILTHSDNQDLSSSGKKL